ncbi:MAG: glycosyltransferase family 4 protein [Saccharospirillum sp.]|nr:glycosyltransferase family 4 protein [Saccharospirillum sp.]
MIIAYIYDLNINPPKGGNQRHAFELVSGFLHAGHTVRVLNDPSMEGVENYREHELTQFMSGIDVLYIRIDARPVRGSIFEHATLSSDAPVVWEVNAPFNETLAYSWLGGQVDLTPESLLKRIKRRIHATRKLPGIYREEKCRKALSKKVAAHICVTDALKQYVTQQLAARKAVTIPNGGKVIPPESLPEKTPNKQFTVLYSGSSLYPWQGIQYLNEVTRMAEAEGCDIAFQFFVPNHPESIADRSNVSVEVGKPYNELLANIRQADLCVALYPEFFWSPWGLHNSPMKLYEYFSLGKATLTSNLGQMRELFTGKEITLLSNNDPRAILTNILAIKNDPMLQHRLEENAYRVVKEEMNWSSNVKKTLSIFKDVVRR